MSSDRQIDPPDPPLGALLRLAHENVQAALYERTAAAGHPQLRPAHFRLLRFPGLEGTRPTRLASRLGTTKQALNPLLNDLERWGYVERIAAPDDGRGRVLVLTARGHELMSTIRNIHRQIEAHWAQRVGDRRFQAVLQVLHEISEAHPDNTRADDARPNRTTSQRSASPSRS